MAKFTVAAANGTSTTYEGKYHINDGGVLSVAQDGGNPVIYSPSGWLALEVKDAPSSVYEERGVLVI